MDDVNFAWINEGRAAVVLTISEQIHLSIMDYPMIKLRSECIIPCPQAGIGGAKLVISKNDHYAALFLFSGQSELGFEVFSLVPELAHIGRLPYTYGENDLTATVFSPDEQLVALALCHRQLWWTHPNDALADWDTPAKGGMVEWAELYIFSVQCRNVEKYVLTVDLPTGWMPNQESLVPEKLHFTSYNQLCLTVPWYGEYVVTLPSAKTIQIPSPK